MRVSKIAASFLAVGVLGTLVAGCGLGSETAEEPEYRLVPVQRGDLTVEVTSTGNLVYSHDEELSFGVAGTVGEVLVEQDDIVEEGQVLARLDAASMLSLQRAVAQARINLRSAEDSLEEARNPSAVVTAADLAQAELAVVSARVAVETAREGLETAQDPYTESDIIQAELAVISAEVALENAQDAYDIAEDRYESNWTVPEWIRDYERKQRQLAIAGFNLAEAEESLAEMQAGADALEVEQKQKQLSAAEASLTTAEEALAEAEENAASLEPDSLEVALRRVELATARAALDEATENLQKDTIVAPFAGIVTSLGMEAGQTVNAHTAIVLTDTARFEAAMLVNEIDILNVRVGALATVEIDALSGLTFPATVTSVSPRATPQQGVVSYQVKAELMSLAPAIGKEVTETEVEPVTSVDQVLEKAVTDGRLTQEQADTLREKLAQAEAGITPEQLEQLIERFLKSQSGFAKGSLGQGADITDEQKQQLAEGFRKGSGTGWLAAGVSLDGLQLREGLSVTVSIVIEQRSNVLLVPNQAISVEGANMYVEVVQGEETVLRSVVTGLSDWQYTEVVEGLNEGEEVVIWQTTGSSTTTETQTRGKGLQLIPGAGRLAK